MEAKPADQPELIDVYDVDCRPTGLVVPRRGCQLQNGQYVLYVYALVENQEGRFLITQRSLDKAWAPGAWEVSGGGVRAGETPGQAIAREVAEETGLVIPVSGRPAAAAGAPGYAGLAVAAGAPGDAGLVAAGAGIEPVYTYRDDTASAGGGYFASIYHFHLQFSPDDVTLQKSEAVGFKLATWDEITELDSQQAFLHYRRLRNALVMEGLLA